MVVVAQSLSHVQLFTTPWTAAHQESLSLIIPQSLLKFMSIESIMSPNHLILCLALGATTVLLWLSLLACLVLGGHQGPCTADVQS